MTASGSRQYLMRAVLCLTVGSTGLFRSLRGPSLNRSTQQGKCIKRLYTDPSI